MVGIVQWDGWVREKCVWGGGGGLWLHLAEQEGDVKHQKHVTAMVKHGKDI